MCHGVRSKFCIAMKILHVYPDLLALLGVSVSMLIVLASRHFNSMIDRYEDVPAMVKLRRVYKESAIPQSLKQSIGACNFTKLIESQMHDGQPMFNGKPSGHIIAQGSRNPLDTCIYFTGIRIKIYLSKIN